LGALLATDEKIICAEAVPPTIGGRLGLTEVLGSDLPELDLKDTQTFQRFECLLIDQLMEGLGLNTLVLFPKQSLTALRYCRGRITPEIWLRQQLLELLPSKGVGFVFSLKSNL